MLVWVFSGLSGFLSTLPKHKHSVKWIGYDKLHLGVSFNVCIKGCIPTHVPMTRIKLTESEVDYEEPVFYGRCVRLPDKMASE